MKLTKAGQSKLLLAGLLAVVLCWSAYFMLSSEKKSDSTVQNRRAGLGDRMPASGAISTTQKKTPEIQAKSPMAVASDQKTDPSGSKSTRRHNDPKRVAEMESSLDEIVMPASKDGEPGVTVRDILALHQKQDAEMRADMNLDELVISSTEDGESGMTVRDILAFHQEQNAEFNAAPNLDEFVIPPSEDGEPGVTVWDILALHEQQDAEMQAAPNMDELVAPPSEDGEIGLTVAEVQALHERQNAEMR